MEIILLVLGPHRTLYKRACVYMHTRVCACTHTLSHMQAYTPIPTSLPSSQWGEPFGPDFSSPVETLILAIWKRDSRADSSGDPLAGTARH